MELKMIFAVGERISILNETGKYTVIHVDSTHVLVEDEHGFEQKVPLKLAVKATTVKTTKIILKDELLDSDKKSLKNKMQMPSIDLHIESLLEYDAKMNAFDKLNYQMRQFREFVNKNLAKRQTKLLVIHGIGEGRLKNEIGALIARNDGYSMHDANYSRGGVGASYIEIVLSRAEPI